MGATAPNHFKELKLIRYKLPQKTIVPIKMKIGEYLKSLLIVNFEFKINPILTKAKE